MNEEMSASARKVQEALQICGVECVVTEMPATTRSAKEAAVTIGCTVAQIAKSLIFRTSVSGRPVLVIASGSNRVDEAKIAAAIGEPIERATPDFVREKTGFVIGGVPPLGHIEPPITFIDEDLFHLETIWAAAGTPFAVFRLTPGELRRIAVNAHVIVVK